MLTFDKLYMNSSDIESFKSRAISFLKSRDVASPQQLYMKIAETPEKLIRLMDGDKKSDITCFHEEFEKFIALVPSWRATEYCDDFKVGEKRKGTTEVKVHLFWSQLTGINAKNVPVVRRQTFGLCFLHAAVVLESYLIAVGTACEKPLTIDVGLYEAQVLLGNTLEEFLLNKEGGDSLYTLSQLCSLKQSDIITYTIPDPQEDHESYDRQCALIMNRVLDKPLLISSFRVHNCFHTSSEVSFSSIPETFEEGNRRHSMLLIGARISAEGEYFFLLQNWWQDRYFIEVSGQYMHHCGATMTFIKKGITTRRPDLISIAYYSPYAETNVDNPEIFFERYNKPAAF